MSKLLRSGLVFLVVVLLAACGEDVPPYKDASLSPQRRADDLLSRMTLEEKLGQLVCPYGWPMYDKLSDSTATYNDNYRDFIDNVHGGWLWGLFRADPWTEKTLLTGLDTRAAISAYNALQKYAVDSTRLGIPIILAEEAPHGHMAIGTTVFPTGLGMASTWDAGLMERIGTAVGEELRAVGACVAYGPVVDIARELRWSRVEETFGEDTYLTSVMAGNLVRGMSVKIRGWERGVIPTLKHFVAYGAPQGGHNGYVSVVGERDLRENLLPVFRHVIDCGAMSVMTSYNSIDGVPCTASRQLVNGMLRDEWGFDGIVVSDLIAIDGLKGTHHIAANLGEAAQKALEAGVDVDLGANCYPLLKERIENDNLKENDIDDAVRRVLEMKFSLGLFDHPYIDDSGVSSVNGREHSTVALEAAREGVILLENNGILPLKKDMKIAVIGPNADRMYNQLGDYTAPQPEENICTPYEGIVEKIGAKNVVYAHGCGIRDDMGAENDPFARGNRVSQGIEDAVRAIQSADVAVVVVGGSSSRYSGASYAETGAALTDGDIVSDMESGEGFDRASLELMGSQKRLLEAAKSTGKPLIVVYVEGRPLDMRWAKENADALLVQFYPGQAGGTALADVLFGDCNPTGRLPVSVPYSVGQLPVHYNQPLPENQDYIDMPAAPLYSFGYGLSYTGFEYESLTCSFSGDSVIVDVAVSNVGGMDGDEVVQLYVTDPVASTVRPRMQLKAFNRVFIPKGERAVVSLPVSRDAFALCNDEMDYVVEPGDFVIQVGPSSDRILLRDTITLH